ncbi:RNA pyrophosphohydrolase [Commensalibacter sp. Nvir]|uniref:RNA pyrophosphohydrolase n=1 Tax=Commensalibacter sp. Nvir TaxID=3069817 RepID=UPI0030C84130
MTNLPYRRNVAAIIFNQEGKIFIALRHDLVKEGIWAFPQGGIDKDETPVQAIKRELHEELGTDQFEILEEYQEWISYDFPKNILNNSLKHKYRGQIQKWFAVRFIGKDIDIRLDTHKNIEFARWNWIDLNELTTINVGYKKDLYRKISKHFAKYSIV